MSVSNPGEKMSGERIANLKKMSECPALCLSRSYKTAFHRTLWFSLSLFQRTLINSLIDNAEYNPNRAALQVEEGGEGSLVSHEESSISLSLPMDLNLLILIFSATLLSVLFFCLLILIVMLKLSQINKKELAILHIFLSSKKCLSKFNTDATL